MDCLSNYYKGRAEFVSLHVVSFVWLGIMNPMKIARLLFEATSLQSVLNFK